MAMGIINGKTLMSAAGPGYCFLVFMRAKFVRAEKAVGEKKSYGTSSIFAPPHWKLI